MRRVSDDNDANAYLLAVESADGQELESGVITAVETFIVGCKSDGIWSALKASCILAGARTLSGALVPLVGTAPTNANFVSADYNRKTGVKGNASTKRLNANRLDNVDPQNSKHLAVYQTDSEIRTINVSGTKTALASPNTTTSSELLTATGAGSNIRRFRINSTATGASVTDLQNTVGFWGASRSGSTNVASRVNGVSSNFSTTSSTPSTGAIGVFSRGGNATISPSDARISFYSIGENLNLTLLDTRVSTLMTSLAAAIP
jgi:hypothetical protein